MQGRQGKLQKAECRLPKNSKERQEGLKEPLNEGERGEHKNGLNFNIKKTKIMADGDSSHKIKRCLLLGKKAMTNLTY